MAIFLLSLYFVFLVFAHMGKAPKTMMVITFYQDLVKKGSLVHGKFAKSLFFCYTVVD